MRPVIPAYRDTMALSKLAGDCLFGLGVRGHSPHTLTEYDIVYRQYIAYLIGAGLTDDHRHFTTETCQAFMLYLGTRGAKPTTIRHKLSTLSTLAKYLMTRQDLRPRVTENPVVAFEWPKRQRPKKEFLFPAELRAFLEVERPVGESMARDLFVDTGLRVSELCGANEEDFVEIAGAWSLYVTVKGEGRQQERVACPISAPVAAGLAAYLRSRPVSLARRKGPMPLLVNTLGARYSRAALGHLIMRIGKAAGITRITVSPHKLRRTGNVVARFADIDSYTRSQLLNHTNPNTIKEYDAVLPGELAAARERQRSMGLRRYLGGA